MALFRSSWGTVELWLASIETEDGRDLVVQKYTRGNVVDVQNKGDVPKVVRCRLLFDDMRGQKEDGRDRLDSMIALKSLGKPQLFTHPIYGTYLAEIGEFVHRIDESSCISGDATFIAVEDVGAITVDPLGLSVDGGVSSVGAAADALDTELAAVEVVSTMAAIARAASNVMEQVNSAREVLVTLSSTSELINQEIDNLQTSVDIELWPVFKSFVELKDAMREAADAVIGDDGGLMTVRIDQPTSLRRFLSNVYGGTLALDMYDDAMQRNDIPTPARIPTGTVLRLLQPKQTA